MKNKGICFFFVPRLKTSALILVAAEPFEKKNSFSLHMHAKPSFTHRLQAAKMPSSRTSAQNNGPRAQNNDPWV